VVDVIHNTFGLRHGQFTTIHDVTATQNVLDGFHKDPRRGRAAGTSLIPTTTGSAAAITGIFPELQGCLDGIAVRVPLTNASLTDCVFEVSRSVTVEEVNAALKEAAAGRLKGILGYEEKPLVSVDYVDDPRSSIVDALSTRVVNGTQVKILTWYDNEIGYVNRLMELARKVAG
jgi:glyceraldehyde 3-phosphate dehydrogenase